MDYRKHKGSAHIKRRRGRGFKTLFFLLLFIFAIVCFVLSILPKPVPSMEDMDLPDFIDVDLISVNEFSRPGDKLTAVNGVVIHYVGNPGTTAENNRSYFQNLAVTGEAFASSNFIIGIDGRVIMCVPIDEVAYCSNGRNEDTLSIECCHPDETGKFTAETEESLIKLTKWLCDTYGLKRDDVIRHYDITGKICPKYYVENPDSWESFLDSVFAE